MSFAEAFDPLNPPERRQQRCNRAYLEPKQVTSPYLMLRRTLKNSVKSAGGGQVKLMFSLV